MVRIARRLAGSNWIFTANYCSDKIWGGQRARYGKQQGGFGRRKSSDWHERAGHNGLGASRVFSWTEEIVSSPNPTGVHCEHVVKTRRPQAGLVVVLGAVQYGSSSDAADADTPAAAQIERAAAPEASCKTDWRLCKDNADLMNNYRRLDWARAECYVAADHKSRYGNGKWGWLKFQTLFAGDDYVKTGVVKMVDDKVSFPNAYGAMEHTRALCHYDLNTSSVQTVSIEDFTLENH